MATSPTLLILLVCLAPLGMAEQVCIDTIPGQGEVLHNLTTIVACSPHINTILDAQFATTYDELMLKLGNATNASVTVRVPENSTNSDPFPAWCGSYVIDSETNSVVQPNFHDNLTQSSVTVAPAWSMRGLTSRDVDAFAMTAAGYGPAPVTVAYSLSNPVDFETNSEMRFIVSSEVAVRLIHDVNGIPSPNIGINVPLDPELHNWTTFTLGVATMELVIVVEDSPDTPVIVRAADVWSDRTIRNAFEIGVIGTIDELLALDPRSDTVISILGGPFPTPPMPLTSQVAANRNAITSSDVKLVQTFESATSQAVGLPIKVFDDDAHATQREAELDLVWELRSLTVEDARIFSKSLVGAGIADRCGRTEELPYPFNMSTTTDYGLVPVCDQIDTARDADILKSFRVQGTVTPRVSQNLAVEASMQLHVNAPSGLQRPAQGFVLGLLVVRDGQASHRQSLIDAGGSADMPPIGEWQPGREVALLMNISVMELPSTGVVLAPEILPANHDLQLLTQTATLNVFARDNVEWIMTGFDGSSIESSLPSWLKLPRISGRGSAAVSVMTNATGQPNGRPAVTFAGRIVQTGIEDAGKTFHVAINMRAGRLVLGTSALNVLVRPGERETALTSVLNAGSDSLTVTLTASASWVGLTASSSASLASDDDEAATAPEGEQTISIVLAAGQSVPIQVSVAPPVTRPQSLTADISITSSDPLAPTSSIALVAQVAWSTACPTDVQISATPSAADATRVDVSNISPFTLSLAVDTTSAIIIDPATGQEIEDGSTSSFVAFGGIVSSSTTLTEANSPVRVRVLQDKLLPASRPSSVVIDITHPKAGTGVLQGVTAFDLSFDVLTWRRTQQEEDFAAATAAAAARVDGGTLGDGGAAASLVRRAAQSASVASQFRKEALDEALGHAGATLIERRAITVRCKLLPGPIDAQASVITALPADDGYYSAGGAGVGKVVWSTLASLDIPASLVYNFTLDAQVAELTESAVALGFGSVVPSWVTPSTLAVQDTAVLEAALGTLVLSDMIGSAELDPSFVVEIPGTGPTAEELARIQQQLEELQSSSSEASRQLRGGAARKLLMCPDESIADQALFVQPACTGNRPIFNGSVVSYQLELTLPLIQSLAQPTQAEVDVALQTMRLMSERAAGTLRRSPLPFPSAIPGNFLLEALAITADEYGQLARPTTSADAPTLGNTAGGLVSTGLEVNVVTLESHRSANGSFVATGVVGTRLEPLIEDVTRINVKPTRTGALIVLSTVDSEQIGRSGQVVTVTGASCNSPALVRDSTGLGCVCGPGFAFKPSVDLGCELCPEGTEKLVAADDTTCTTCPSGLFSLGGMSRCRACLPLTNCAEGRASVVPGTWHEDPVDHLAAINSSLAEAEAGSTGTDSPEITALPLERRFLAPSARHKWWLQVSSLRFHQCPITSACPVNESLLDSAQQACANGHAGPLCAVCLDGFATATGLAGSECQECWDEASSWLATVAAVAGVVALLAVVAMPSKAAIESASSTTYASHDNPARAAVRRPQRDRRSGIAGPDAPQSVKSAGSSNGGGTGGGGVGRGGRSSSSGGSGRRARHGPIMQPPDTAASRTSEPASAPAPGSVAAQVTALAQTRSAAEAAEAAEAAARASSNAKSGKRAPTLMDEVLKANAERLKAKTAAAKERATPVMRSLVNYLQALAVLATLRISGGESVRTTLALAEVAGGATLSLLPVQCATGMSFLERFTASLSLPLVACVAPFAIAVVFTLLQFLIRAVRPIIAPALAPIAAVMPCCSQSSTAGADDETAVTRPGARHRRGWRSCFCCSGGEDASEAGLASPASGSTRALTSGPSMDLESVVVAARDGGDATSRRRKRSRDAASLKGLALLRHNLRSASYSVVAILFVIHFGTLRAIFRAFEVYPSRIYGVIFLQADYITHTESDTYSAIIMPLAVVGGIVYGLGIPLLGVSVLVRNSNRLRHPAVLARYGFLYQGLSLTRRGRYLFEGVVLVRKTGLALIAAFGTADALGQGYLAALWLLLFLVTHLVMKPYTDSVVNGLEAVSLTTLTISQVANMYYEASGLSWLPVLVLLGNACTIGAFVVVLLALSSTAARYGWLQVVRAVRAMRDELIARFCTTDARPGQDDDATSRAAAAAAAAEDGGSARRPTPSPSATALLGASVTRSSETRLSKADSVRRPTMVAFSNPMRKGTSAVSLDLAQAGRSGRKAGRDSVARSDLRGKFTIRRDDDAQT